MKNNGKSESLLAGLVIPGATFDDNDYASLKLRLDCYDDFILARKFDDGQGGPLYALDPLDVAAGLAGLNLGTPLLPRNCLFWQRNKAAERLAIYIEPQVWAVNMAAHNEADDQSRQRGNTRHTWRVPLPGLVWIGADAEYSLYAVKEAGWPGPETELFRAPCPNVGDHICLGNVKFPAAGAATIWPAWTLFVESDFNNHLANGKSREYSTSVLMMWRRLHNAEADTYPLADLVSANVRLGKVLGE